MQYAVRSLGMAGLPSIQVEDYGEITAVVAEDSEVLKGELSSVIANAVQEDRPLTKEEADEFNRKKNAWINRVGVKLTDKIASITEVYPGDTADVARRKIEVAERTKNVLTQILNYIGEKIMAIISQIKEGAKWVWEKVCSFFRGLYSWLTGN